MRVGGEKAVIAVAVQARRRDEPSESFEQFEGAEHESGAALEVTALAAALRLPAVGDLEITGVGGGGGIAPVYAARVEIAGTALVARLVAYGSDVIVGRDVLNRLVTLLDGPRLRLRLLSRRR